MQRKLLPFRNYALRRAFRFALDRIRAIERIAAPDCSAPADQEAHLSSNILFGVAASITLRLQVRLASHCDLEVKRKKKNGDTMGNNLIYPLRGAYTRRFTQRRLFPCFLVIPSAWGSIARARRTRASSERYRLLITSSFSCSRLTSGFACDCIDYT